MRTKTPRVIVTFHTTAEAIALEQACGQSGLDGRLISAPRSLSADCGIAWSAPPELRNRIERLLSDGGIEAAGIFEMAV